MRFLLDQNVHARLVPFLVERGHGVTRIARDYPPGLPDDEILAIAYREGRIVITYDRDYGELVFAELQPHAGVIYLRLGSAPPLATVVARLDYVLTNHAQDLDAFIVLTHDLVRIRR